MLSTFTSFKVIKYTRRQKENANRANDMDTLVALFTATVPESASYLTLLHIVSLSYFNFLNSILPRCNFQYLVTVSCRLHHLISL